MINAFTVLALALPLMAWPIRSTECTKQGHAEAELNCLLNCVKDFWMDMDRAPTDGEGWTALLQRPAGDDNKRWDGPYLDPAKVPVDPWGTPFVYHYPGKHDPAVVEIYSCGPDKMSASDGNDPDDISSWRPTRVQRSFAAEHPRIILAVCCLLGLTVTVAAGWLLGKESVGRPRVGKKSKSGVATR